MAPLKLRNNTVSPHFVRFWFFPKARTMWNSHNLKQIWTILYLPLGNFIGPLLGSKPNCQILSKIWINKCICLPFFYLQKTIGKYFYFLIFSFGLNQTEQFFKEFSHRFFIPLKEKHSFCLKEVSDYKKQPILSLNTS